MTLSLSTNIKNRVINKQVLTICTCIKIVLKNGTKIGFTTHTSNVRFKQEPNMIYYSKGFTPTVVSKNNSMSVDNADGQMIIDNNLVNESDLESGIYNNAYYELFEFDWTLKTNGFYDLADRIKEINGTIGEVKRDKLQFKTEYRSLSQYLALTIIDVYKMGCNASLGDSRCTVNVNALENDGITPKYTSLDTIGAVIKSNNFIVNITTKPTGFFNNGIIEFLSGANVGRKYTIKSWDLSNKTITLQMPTNYPIAIGDSIKLTKGCNKTKEVCKEFSNYVNYRGFINIPGMDFIVSGGGTKINY